MYTRKRKIARGGLPYKKRKLFVPGKDRIGGYYGRYTGVKGELKFFDQGVTDAVVDAGGTVTDTINDIAQGVTEKQRVGRKCVLKSIWVKYLLSLPEQDAQATPVVGDSLRLIVYNDRQCNGATAAVLDVLETADILSFKNLANEGRFQILCDKTMSINYLSLASDGAGVVSQASVEQWYTFYKKLDTPIEFNAATGAITEIRSNNIGFIVISESGICGFNSKWRVRFADG